MVPDSFRESARSDSRLRRDWFVGARPIWSLLVAHLFIWNGKYFDQPLPQLAIDWESSLGLTAQDVVAGCRFALSRNRLSRTLGDIDASAFRTGPDVCDGCSLLSEVRRSRQLQHRDLFEAVAVVIL